MQQTYTAKSVARGHPDKLCDQIADAILDDCLSHDRHAHVACEVLATQGHIVVAGKITCTHPPNVEAIARAVLNEIGYDGDSFQVTCLLHSLERDEGRAATGQGIVVGYACDETWQYLPLPVVLAHRLTQQLDTARRELPFLGPDGNAQVTVEYDELGRPSRIDTVVLSAQHSQDVPQDELFFELTDKVVMPALSVLPPDENTKLLLDPAGGGPDAGTGITGRKVAADTYGVFAPQVGSLSGRDHTQVERSGAYMARYIAKNLVAARLCKRCQVTLAYAMGRAEPVMVEVDTFGSSRYCEDDCLADVVKTVFGLTPQKIIRQLDLLSPRYLKTAAYGHFGRREFPWERTDQVAALQNAVF